jgi:hypothetical protein
MSRFKKCPDREVGAHWLWPKENLQGWISLVELQRLLINDLFLVMKAARHPDGRGDDYCCSK